MGLKPSQTIELLKRYIVARENVLLIGDPGMGKSEMVDQATRAVNYGLMTNIPGIEDPTESGGLPWFFPNMEYARKVPFERLWQLLNSKRPMTWFWDDFGLGMPATQNSYMHWAQARRVENHVLPEHVSIVAATNRRGAGMGVQGVLEPILGRFHCVEVDTDLDDWQKWFIENHEQTYPRGIRVLAFLSMRPELLNQPKQKTGDMIAWPSPRSNFALCRAVQMDLPQSIRFGAYTAAVGAGYAGEFLAFEKFYDEMPSLDAVIADPNQFKVPDNASINYAMAVGLASKATEQNFGRLCTWFQKMYDANKGDISALAVRDSIRRNPKVCNTAAYIKLASTDLGKLFRGEG